MSNNLNDQEREANLKEFWERARKGVLVHLNEKGGILPMAQMHDFSLNKYFIQHQRFSQMMESFVDEGLISFDQATYAATITEAGKEFIK